MKKVFLSLIVLAVAVSCNKQLSQSEETGVQPNNFLSHHVLSALLDTTRSGLEVKDEILVLLDTLQQYAQFHPKKECRIWAKSTAAALSALTLHDEDCSPEEMAFYLDTVAGYIADIQGTWYRADSKQIEENNSNEPLLSNIYLDYNVNEKCDSRRYDLQYYIKPSGEYMLITLPDNAIGGISIMFSDEVDMTLLDDVSFHQKDSYGYIEPSDEDNYTVIFDEDLIKAMMQHFCMFVGYVDKDESKPMVERFHDQAILLSYFQDAYKSLHTK